MIVINDDRKKPNGMLVSHLPDGPTLHFKLSTSKIRVSSASGGTLYWLRVLFEILAFSEI